MKKWLLSILVFILGFSTTMLGWNLLITMDRNYNSEGNYFDYKEGVVYNEQGIMVYGILTFLMLLLTLLVAWKLIKSFKQKDNLN